MLFILRESNLEPVPAGPFPCELKKLFWSIQAFEPEPKLEPVPTIDFAGRDGWSRKRWSHLGEDGVSRKNRFERLVGPPDGLVGLRRAGNDPHQVGLLLLLLSWDAASLNSSPLAEIKLNAGALILSTYNPSSLGFFRFPLFPFDRLLYPSFVLLWLLLDWTSNNQLHS